MGDAPLRAAAPASRNGESSVLGHRGRLRGHVLGTAELIGTYQKS